MRAINGDAVAYRAALQSDGMTLVELIDLSMRGYSYHWTTGNQPLTYTLSGVPTTYEPFPGTVPNGIEDGVDLGVSVIDFVVANSGSILRTLLQGGAFAEADLAVGRVFPDTPDLGRMEIFVGKIGDYAHNRMEIKGQARNAWQSLSTRFPYHVYGDKCTWRFGSDGCGFNTASITTAVAEASVNVSSSTTLNILLSSGFLSNSYASGRFDFGRLTVTGGVNSGQVRTIRQHTGDLVALSHPLPFNSFAGITLEIFPGCRKRILEDCHSTYNNARNFMGFPWIPVQEDAF